MTNNKGKEMKIEIKNRWTGNVIFGGEYSTVLACLLAATAAGADLRGADLRDADLRGADLRGADLSDADLRGADLRDADLRGADLRDADLRGADLRDADLRGADLRGADLSDADLRGADLRGADLRDADLSGADLCGAVLRDADLSDADLSDADLRGADLCGADLCGAVLRDAVLSGCPVTIPEIHKAVYEAASQPCALDMKNWHYCETTHCRAGWVVTLAGEGGKALEWAMGTSAAAAMIYMASDPEMDKIPNFYCGNEEALADMKRLAEAEASKGDSEIVK